MQFRTTAFRAFLRLMVPRMASVGIEPLTFAYFTAVAAALGAGSITALNFALDYQVLPVSLIGVSFSLAVFPVLSAAFSRGDRHGFRRVLLRNVAVIGLLTSAAAIALFVLSGILVEVLLGGGRFDPEAVALTASVVAPLRIVDPVRRPGLSPVTGAVRDPQHDLPGDLVIRRAGGRGAPVRPCSGRWGSSPSRLATRSGLPPRMRCLRLFLVRRVRGRIGLNRPG